MSRNRGTTGGWARRIATVPNLLTLVRLPLAVAVIAVPGDRELLLAIIVAAAASDVLDGRVAVAIRQRRLARGAGTREIEAQQAVGAWLDPLCDKIFVLAVIAAVYVGFEPPAGVVLLALTRELVLLPLLAIHRLVPWMRRELRFGFRADWMGKLTTALQFVTVMAVVLLPGLAWPAAWAAGVWGGITAAHYVHRSIRVARAAARNSIVLARSEHEPR